MSAASEPTESKQPVEDKLRRFLYLNDVTGMYYTGNPEPHLPGKVIHVVNNWTNVDLKESNFFSIISEVNKDESLPRRQNIFCILANLFSNEKVTADNKLAIREHLFTLLKSDEDFFYFVKYYTMYHKRKIGTGLRKCIIQFYNKKTSLEFAKSVTEQESYHGWKHKDLIKLCHLKPQNEEFGKIINFVLFGPSKLPRTETEDAIYKKLDNTHKLRHTTNPQRAAELIKELNASITQVNSKLYNEPEVWNALIPLMSIKDILKFLVRFYKNKFLEVKSTTLTVINKSLEDPERIEKSNLHPITVFIYLKLFQRGGKILDPKLIHYLRTRHLKEETLSKLIKPPEVKCQDLIQKIEKCLKLSYKNVSPINKKIMVAIDPMEKTTTPCSHCQRITCFEALYQFIRLYLLKAKDVTFVVLKDNDVIPVDFKNLTQQKTIDKIVALKGGYILPSASVKWAIEKGNEVDVFIYFVSCEWYQKVPRDIKAEMLDFSSSLNLYHTQKASPDTKMVRICLGGNSGFFKKEDSKHLLSIEGLSSQVPNILDAFVTNKFC